MSPTSKPYLAAIGAVLCASSLAQTSGPSLPVAPNAGQLLREQSPAPLAAPPKARPLVVQPGPDAPALPPDDSLVTVQRFEISGNTRIATDELAVLLTSASGQALRFAQVQQAVDRITQHYRARGYFLARAIIPRQSMQSGVLQVLVLEGVLGQISAGQGAAGANPATTELANNLFTAQGLALGQPVQTAALERALLLFAERGYPDAVAGLAPGNELGTTALNLRWGQYRPQWQGSVGIDNSGSPYTGTSRLLADISRYDLGSQGSELAARTSLSDDKGGSTQYLSLGYSTPMGYRGLRAGASLSALNYALGGPFSALQATGKAQVASANLRYPLILRQNTQSQLEASLNQRHAQDHTLAGNVNHKRSHYATLGASYTASGERLSQRLQAQLSLGQVNLDNNPGAAQQDAASAQTAGRYSKLRLDYIAAYPLRAGQQLQARASHQSASKNLDSADKFSLGGPSGVRGWPVGEASGDEGSLLSLEWRKDLGWSTRLASAFSAFLDWGQITQHKTPWANALAAGVPNRYSLASAGVGISLGQATSWSAQLMIATPLGSSPVVDATGHTSDGGAKRSRTWLSLNKTL